MQINVSSLISVIVLAVSVSACTKVPVSAVPETSGPPVIVDGQYAYGSPDEAVLALKSAVRSSDSAQLLNILGPDAKEVLNSGDPVADANGLRAFSSRLDEKADVVILQSPKDPNRRMAALLAGANEWAFPIPLVEQDGRWHFDTPAGKEEILNRRIGENELRVILLFGEYIDAQREYHSIDRDNNNTLEYAQKLLSSPGRQDGLYWERVEGQPLSPMGPLVALASAQGYQAPQAGKTAPFHGYYFRILTSQGSNARGGAMNYVVNGRMTKGFALLAYPAKWEDSGTMTFQGGSDGVVYQKNLGPDTDKIAAGIDNFDPDLSWTPTQLWQ